VSSAAPALAVSYVRLIAEQMERLGVPVELWLGPSGITRDQINDDHFSIDLQRFYRLALDAQILTDEPALGLRLGERWGVQAHGALGYAAMNSRTIREVLELIQRYIGLRVAFLTLAVQPHPSEVRVVLTEILPLGQVRGMVLEAVVSSIKGVLEDVSMGTCEIKAVAFPFPAPGHAEYAASVLACSVRYDQTWTGFALSPRMLDLPLKTSDPRAFRLADEMCQRELLRLQARRSWVAKVQRLLLETRVGFPSLDQTARQLHVTPRTLHRRLVDEGTSYRVILDDLRHRSALEQLQSGHVTIQEVAYILGYSDPANFRRAFRRWTGGPPSGLRNGSTPAP
jgi:AraC-like DNA-binding protein